MPVLFNSKTQCCGCGACFAACPKKAIEMKTDGVFSYPVIDTALCIECGKCEKVCRFKDEKNTQSNTLSAFAVKADDETRAESSSGGIFTLITDEVLSSGGTVFGAVYDEKMNVIHAAAGNKEERNRMRGSKYVGSDTSAVFEQVKNELTGDKQVVFSGTPCQVSALKSYLGREYDNLLLIDIICHGVPSPEIWKSFVKLMEKKYGKKITDYRFRNKAVAWREYSPLVSFEDGSTAAADDLNGAFIEVFRYELCLRPSCTACRYTSVHREGDITIGDFWGIEKQLPEIDDNKGISAVTANTEKGRGFLESIKAEGTFTPCTQEMIAAGQVNMKKCSVISPKSEDFLGIYQKDGIEKALKKYTRTGMTRKTKDFIKSLLK